MNQAQKDWNKETQFLLQNRKAHTKAMCEEHQMIWVALSRNCVVFKSYNVANLAPPMIVAVLFSSVCFALHPRDYFVATSLYFLIPLWTLYFRLSYETEKKKISIVEALML